MIGNTILEGVPPSRNGHVHLKGAYATIIKTGAMPATNSPTIAKAPVTSKIDRISEKRSSASDKSI